MPRKVDPRLNEQSDALPTDFVDDFVMPEGIERLLPSCLDQDEKPAALDNIKHALGEYAWELKAGPHQYTRAEASKALRHLLDQGDFSRQAVGALNLRAYYLLYDMVEDETQQWMLGFDKIETPVEDLTAAAKKAISSNDAQRGPDKSIPLAILVSRLCHVYEDATGQKVTHHTKTPDLAYSQKAQTEAGRFVTAIILATFSDVPGTRINQCLREFVQHRPERF